ncbi:TPA: hypothetical protein ACPZXP_002929, partial [Citrobacter freundii]
EIEKLDVTEHVKNWRQFQVSIISYYSRKPGLFIFFRLKELQRPDFTHISYLYQRYEYLSRRCISATRNNTRSVYRKTDVDSDELCCGLRTVVLLLKVVTRSDSTPA